VKIHHLRNATFVIESGPHHILIDPMLSDKAKLPPFAVFAHKLARNPLVSLPPNASTILERVTACLVTHSQKWGIEALTHTDHFDKQGKDFRFIKIQRTSGRIMWAFEYMNPIV